MMLVRTLPRHRGMRCGSPAFGRRFYNAGEGHEENHGENHEETRASWVPATDIFNTEDNYVLKMEIPGFAKDELDIEFKDSVLSVKGERKEEEKKSEDENYHWIERNSGSFARSFRFPKNVEVKKIDATLKDGILELRVAKPEETKPKTVPISVH